jgi:hypothetical protein
MPQSISDRRRNALLHNQQAFEGKLLSMGVLILATLVTTDRNIASYKSQQII